MCLSVPPFCLLFCLALKFEDLLLFSLHSRALVSCPNAPIWKVNAGLCVKNQTRKSQVNLSPGLGRQIFPSFGKLSWMGPAIHFSANYRTDWAEQTAWEPCPNSRPVRPAPEWRSPLLGTAGCECHHPRRPEGRRHNWGRGRRELGRTFKPDTTLSTSKLQFLNE